MIRQKKQTTVLYGCFAALGAAALSATTACTSKASTATITVGSLNATSTGQGPSGPAMYQAMQLAVADINAAGGILSGKYAIDIRDTKNDPQLTTSNLKDLLAEKVPVIIGAGSSGNTVLASTLTIPADVLLITSSAGLSSIADLQDNDTVFRTCGNANAAMDLTAKQAFQDGRRKMAVVWDTQPLDIESASRFVSSFTALGGTVVTQDNYPLDADPATYDFSSHLATALSQNPDGVMLASYPPGASKMLTLWSSNRGNLSSSAWYLGPALADEDFAQGVAATAGSGTMVDMRSCSGAEPVDRPEYAAWRKRFEAAQGSSSQDDPQVTGATYDAAILVALAIARAGTATDVTKIRDALREVANPPGQQVSAADLTTALKLAREGKDIDYVGVVSSEDFDAKGEAPSSGEVFKFDSNLKLVPLQISNAP